VLPVGKVDSFRLDDILNTLLENEVRTHLSYDAVRTEAPYMES
jgi:hypothetical protein